MMLFDTKKLIYKKNLKIFYFLNDFFQYLRTLNDFCYILNYDPTDGDIPHYSHVLLSTTHKHHITPFEISENETKR